ncbi:selenocysteine-specific elongation factor [bacterium BMS3Bbin05]|nr:selenocysteine-specific elongation factor [bacterium BMS3Bbin05]HDO21573.1 selenocysteine-specific translation elongation factor [Nitrospirota bacterium]
MRYIIMGTAGHIDHGKSAIVKALTGTDPDRLKEEKARGITIDLGFAELSWPGGPDVGIVDVPGHERLIKNMLAGAGGLDIVLFVIAADEGIMPQSREHLAICNLLDIQTGLIAVTKSDLVEPDWLELVMEEVRDFVKGSFLEGADIVAVSSKTGENIENLKEKIKGLALGAEPKRSNGMFRLPMDRVFTLKGFGTVVTGTALSGRLNVDDKVEIQPSGIKSRVRGLQSHGKSIRTALAGQRVAVNLQGVEKDDLHRGDVVVLPDRIYPTRSLDAAIELLKGAPEVKNRSQAHLHIGTSESVARIILYDSDAIKGGQKGFCQLRLEFPVTAMSGDRFVIRRLSPVKTIGGGAVLDPHPYRRRKKDGVDDLRVYDQGSVKDKISVKIRKTGAKGMALKLIEGWIDEQKDEINRCIEELKKEGRIILFDNVLLHSDTFNVLGDKILGMLSKYHKENPLEAGMPKEVLRRRLRMENRMFMAVISRIRGAVMTGDLVHLEGFKVALSGADEETKERIVDMLRKGGFRPPFKEEIAKELSRSPREIGDILKILSKEGHVERINDSVYLIRELVDPLLSKVRGFFARKGEMTVAEFRDLLDTSRKYALPFLEYLDTNKVTIRVGEVRKMVKK